MNRIVISDCMKILKTSKEYISAISPTTAGGSGFCYSITKNKSGSAIVFVFYLFSFIY